MEKLRVGITLADAEFGNAVVFLSSPGGKGEAVPLGELSASSLDQLVHAHLGPDQALG